MEMETVMGVTRGTRKISNASRQTSEVFESRWKTGIKTSLRLEYRKISDETSEIYG